MPQTQHLVVITGSSRGLGLAMAQNCLAQPNHQVIGIARHTSAALHSSRCASGSQLEQWALDLAQPLPAARRLQDALGALDAQRFASATLINNAALVTPPGPLTLGEDSALSDALRVGLEAPLLLARAFMAATAGWSATRKLLNISSGLGRRAMAGTAAYCAVKAGLDHFSRALALDEALHPNGVRVVSLAPGVIDTDMQVQLRAADAAVFPDQAMFVQLKAGGKLDSPESAAAKVLAYLARADFGANPVADVRE